tara:strand:+ start:300 stop:533 length:234 start_codon:yes stop_codon:yes gene_type:complete
MEKYFVESFIVTLVFFVYKLFEKKFLLKEKIVLKDLVKDSIIIYLCGLMGLFIFDQIDEQTLNIKHEASAYTNNPEF